jgi:pyranose oxidase
MGAQKRIVAGAIDGAPNYYVDWTGSDTILGDLIGPDNRVADGLEILEQHRAEEILHNGSVVSGVRVRNLANLELIEFRAREVCMACGTFLSALLLWKSNIRPPALGKFIGDNPVVTGMLGFGPRVIEQLRADPDNPARADSVPIAWTEPSPKSEIEPTADAPWLIHLSRTGRTQYYPQIGYDVRLSLDITGYSTVESRPENRLEFSDRMTDRFGMPQMTIHYSMTDQDKKVHEALRRDILELGNRLGGFYQQPACLDAGTSLHYTGVTRMGTDTSDSVVDPFCRVHDFENLHIGGGGVLPESIASNPTLTCCAIAFRSAAAILGVTADALADRICPDRLYAQDSGIPIGLVD